MSAPRLAVKVTPHPYRIYWVTQASIRQSNRFEVAGYVHRMSEAVQQQRWAQLGRLYGSLPEPDGIAFEEALIGARRLPPNG